MFQEEEESQCSVTWQGGNVDWISRGLCSKDCSHKHFLDKQPPMGTVPPVSIVRVRETTPAKIPCTGSVPVSFSSPSPIHIQATDVPIYPAPW